MSTVAAFGAIMTSSTPVALGFLVIPGSEHFGVTTAQFLIYFTLFLLTSAALFGFTGAAQLLRELPMLLLPLRLEVLQPFLHGAQGVTHRRDRLEHT